MRLWSLAIFILLISVSFVRGVPTVSADAPDPPLANQPRPDQFPGLSMWNPAENELLNFGIFRYRIEDHCNASNVVDAVYAAIGSLSFQSGMIPIESPNGWRIRVLCGVEWTAAAGTNPGVVGCLCEDFPYNVNIVLNGTMKSWSSDISRLAVAIHEIMHAALTWNEQYGVGIVCISGWVDFMNCGPDSRHDFGYIEISRLQRTTIAAPSGGTLLGQRTVIYGPSDYRGVRIAVFFQTYTGFIYWAGVHLPPCSSSIAVGFFGTTPLCAAQIPDPGNCQGVYLGAENALPISWGRDLQYTGWSQCS